MWLKNLFLIFCAVVFAQANEDIITQAKPGHEYVEIRSSIGKARTVAEFVTSHKIPESVPVPIDDKYENDSEESRTKNLEINVKRIGNVEQSLDPADFDDLEGVSFNSKRQARVELENFSNSGVIQEDGVKKVDSVRSKEVKGEDAVITGVQVSSEYPTTMRPILTTASEYSRASFDFVPVNKIREDTKNSWTPFAYRNFDDLGDVSLVPAGSSSRIQVKKGPNGKDYEYEYVYYYYDEEDESKASASNNNQEGVRTPTTPAPSRRGGNSNRSKYTSVDRPSTVEPATNEIIPKNGRGRQLTETEEVAEERLPTNTRFPPRSRSNHNTGTTEPTRARGNRPRPSLELVDSSSFRTHPEGPEFPQTLPKGPVRFLGVTPNENVEESSVRSRGRPQKPQEPAPVMETTDDVVPPQRRRPVNDPTIEVEFNRGTPSRQLDEKTPSSSVAPLREEEKASGTEESHHSEATSEGTTFETPTTEYSTGMDKVALDLYAFSQQGQNNLVDTVHESDDSSESTTSADDPSSTESPTTTEIASPTTDAITTTTETPTTTTTTTTTTTEAPTTTTQAVAGPRKFRRPGVPGSRNRFKSSGSTTTTTEAPLAEVTSKPRNRFGGSSGGGFKRPRPGAKRPVQEEEVEKEAANGVNAEKPLTGRNRFRSAVSKFAISTTTSAPAAATNAPSGASRPVFNKININRRRGRPTTAAPATSEEIPESEQPEVTPEATPSTAKPRLHPAASRLARPGRLNLRRPGQRTTTTTTVAPEVAEGTAEEPASEGTEEETREAPAETASPARHTTMNPLDKLRSKNRLPVQAKTTARASVLHTPRRSPLLPRRRTTEAPVVETNSNEELAPEVSSEAPAVESEATEAATSETSTAASTKHEETRVVNPVLAGRRRLTARRPGQLLNRE